MWLYLSAKCGRQPTPCFERRFQPTKPHFLGLLTEAINAGTGSGASPPPTSRDRPRTKAGRSRKRSGDNGLQKDQAPEGKARPGPRHLLLHIV